MIGGMIRSFADREAERLFQREFSRRFPPDIQCRARIKLEILDAAERLEDLQQPPSNNLELLVGDRQDNIAFGSIGSGASVLFRKKAVPMTQEKLPPIHPGEILNEEFLQPHGLSQYRLAKEIGVPARRINEIVQGKRGITPDTALRLSRYFGLSERFWMNLQSRYDLEVEKDRLAERLQQEVRVFVPVPA